MSKARISPLRSGFVHLALAAYTVVALFPVVLTIVNSLKDKNAIFRTPLALPTAETFSLIGYTTVLKQGDFIGYFQNISVGMSLKGYTQFTGFTIAKTMFNSIFNKWLSYHRR